MELTDVPGIGEKLAEKLKKLLAGRALADCLKEPEIAGILPQITKAFFKYKPIDKIPRKTLTPVVKRIEKLGGIVAGSYRRGKEYCNDLDVLVSRELAKGLIDKLDITEPFAEGSEIVRAMLRLKSKVYVFCDIFIYDELPAYLLYATGSKNFNKMMRGVAKKKGFLLNQHGLFQDNKKIPVTSEEDIFDKIGLRYHEPWERNL